MGKRKTPAERHQEFARQLETVVNLANQAGFNDGRRSHPTRDSADAFRRSVELTERVAAARLELTRIFTRALRSRGRA